MKKRYPERILFLEVRSWNKRAIKSYEKLGFKITNTVISKDRLGNDTEFIEMEM
jgi:ribosomal protein S18 acetylase RimI-like enzyme